ncbi:uncharacterized protein [Solanum lycopersicum]|uniref:uncharacterized protein n=1 Tax=Solanum lycopersicum TaxID=4081 RepID=UPI003749D8A7
MVCEPILKLLKKDAPTKWTEECQTAFDAIKNYLYNPPVLVPPREGSPLSLYLSISDSAFRCAMPTGKLAKWKMLLIEFYIVYVTQKMIKAQTLDYHITENLVDEEYEPLKTYFHNEEVSFVVEDIYESCPGWRLFFDGAANHQGKKGIGAVLVSESFQHYPMIAKLRFNCMNNMAEYELVFLG